MDERERIEGPTELIYLPRPSWAPALFALGAALLVNGIYGEGFLFPADWYMIAGAVIVLAALRSMITEAVRGFYERPRRQRVRGAVLPASTLKPPPKRG
jgi:hypothetical protein